MKISSRTIRDKVQNQRDDEDDETHHHHHHRHRTRLTEWIILTDLRKSRPNLRNFRTNMTQSLWPSSVRTSSRTGSEVLGLSRTSAESSPTPGPEESLPRTQKNLFTHLKNPNKDSLSSRTFRSSYPSPGLRGSALMQDSLTSWVLTCWGVDVPQPRVGPTRPGLVRTSSLHLSL